LKKKLAILSYSLAGGGAERVVSNLLYGLKEHYEITLVLMQDKIGYKIPSDIKLYFLEKSDPTEPGVIKLAKLPYLGWKYKKFCQQNSIEISLAFMNRPSYISVFAKIFFSRAKTVISERSTPSMIYGHNTLLDKVNKFLIRRLYPKADFIISNSEGNKLDLIKNFAIDKTLIETLYNPFDLKQIEQLSAKAVKDINFKKFTFISVGRLDAGKNHRLLIDAFSQLKQKNIQLIILGEGELHRELEKQIKILNLEEKVILQGFESNPYQYLLRSHVFVFSSNYEGFPNVLIEALACGLSLISTDCQSGPREILAPDIDITFHLKAGVEKAKYGLLVPPASVKDLSHAMNSLFENKELYQNYRDQAKHRAFDFETKKVLKKWISTLDNL